MSGTDATFETAIRRGSPEPPDGPRSTAHAPPPRRAYQRLPSAGALTTPTCSSPSRSMPDQRAEQRHPAHEVVGAVDRVEVPADAGVRVAGPEFLADDAVRRERVGDSCPQLLLDPAVGLGDEGPVGLRLDDEVAAERTQRDRVGRVAQLEGKFEPTVQLGLVAAAERGRPLGAELRAFSGTFRSRCP